MYRRILVAVDGSAASDGALRESVKLAKDQAAKLRIVHVAEVLLPAAASTYGMGMAYLDYDQFRSSVLSAAKEILERAVRDARKRKVEAESVLLEDVRRDPSVAILKAAASWRADLIVIGTHGRSGVKRILMGSVAEGVARGTPVPLLLVRTTARAKEREGGARRRS